MAAAVMNTVIRSILNTDLEMPAEEVIKKARAQGVKQPDKIIKHNIYNLRSSMRKDVGKPIAAVARTTVAPKSPAKPTPSSKPAPVVSKPSPALDLKDVFANVALVNKVVAACGGVDQARQVAAAVRACGGLDAFVQHLDLLAGLQATS